MKKFLLAVVAVAAFGAPQAATNLGTDIGSRSHVAATAYTGTGSDKSVFRTAGNAATASSLVDVSAAGAQPSTYALMFLGLGLIGLSLRSRRNTR